MTSWRALPRTALRVAAAHVLRALTTLLCGRQSYYSYFAGGRTEEQRGLAIGLRSHSWYVGELGLQTQAVWLQSMLLAEASLSV